MKEKILAEYNNNRTQWMLQHDCLNDKDVLFKMMELYSAEVQSRNTLSYGEIGSGMRNTE